MKKFRRILLVAAAVALGAPGAWAAVNCTHHDMQTWNNNAQLQVCFPCHGATDVNNVVNYGNVGALCVTRCHSGSGGADFAGSDLPIPNRPATATDLGAYTAPQPLLAAINVTQAHGLAKADLTDPKDGAGEIAWHTSGTSLPYGGQAVFECTTCHNVHDNTHTPFLHGNLFTGGPTATQSFCERCHYGDRGNNWNGAGGTTDTEVGPNGEHPTNVALVLGTVVSRTLGGRIARFIQIDDYPDQATGSVYDVTSPTTLQTKAQGYVTGGKVSGFGAAANGTTFGCYTCHSAHMDAGATANLVLRDTVAATTNAGQWNPLCVGCHGKLVASATEFNEENPGVTAWTHPANSAAPDSVGGTSPNILYSNSTGTFGFSVNLTGILGYAGVIGNITNGGVGIDTGTHKPRCTSCHDVHGGVSGTMAIADLDGTEDGAMTTGAICYTCHDGAGLPDVADNRTNAGEPLTLGTGTYTGVHHRTSTRTGTVPTTAWATADATDPLTIDSASWAAGAGNTGDTFGSLADGLQCADCHVFDGRRLNAAGVRQGTTPAINGTAHNW